MFERPEQASSFSANGFDKGISFGSRVARTARFGGQLARLSFLHTLVVSDNRLYKSEVACCAHQDRVKKHQIVEQDS